MNIKKKREGSIPRAGEGKQPSWGHREKNIWVLGWHAVLAQQKRTRRERSILLFHGLIYRNKVEATESI